MQTRGRSVKPATNNCYEKGRLLESPHLVTGCILNLTTIGIELLCIELRLDQQHPRIIPFLSHVCGQECFSIPGFLLLKPLSSSIWETTAFIQQPNFWPVFSFGSPHRKRASEKNKLLKFNKPPPSQRVQLSPDLQRTYCNYYIIYIHKSASPVRSVKIYKIIPHK